MRHEEGFFQGLGNARIYHQCWLPDGEVRAVLFIVHGVGEHSGRYMNVVNHFVPLGYGVYGLDHLGHGRSDGMRKDIGRFEDFTDTLKTYFDSVRLLQPGKPVVLVGHSLGALIGAFYLLDHQAELAGAVLSGATAKVPASISPATIAVGRALSRIAPRLHFLGLDVAGICRDPSVVQAYIHDPLVDCGKATVRMGMEQLRALQRVQAEAATIQLPILLLHGGADRLVEAEGARLLYDAVGSTDKTLKIYDGLYHEVYNEPERATVLHDLEGWLQARV